MTDTEILNEVYRRLKGDDPHGYKTNPLKDGVASFIEREWQRHDDETMEQEAKDLYADTKFSKHWYTDVRDMERHRGLEIGPDGTVKKLK